MRRLTIALALGAVALQANAENTLLGVHKSWIAQTYAENDAKVCMIWSQPETTEGNYTQRGDVYVFVTHRQGSRGKIRFEAGYDFKSETTVTVAIDDNAFQLVTDGSTAWFLNGAEDQAMVRAMRAGRTMVVNGVSSRGTETKDTYSLYGFTAAYKSISSACP